MTNLAESELSVHQWWGPRTLDSGATGRLELGPLNLWLTRYTTEWRIQTVRDGDPLSSALAAEFPTAVRPPVDAQSVRFGVSSTAATVTAWPALADRPIVSRPDEPFEVPPNEEVTLFVGSPLWLRLTTGQPSAPLTEVPIFRPSDTWFGPTTSEGELCYATRTYCRMDLNDVPLRPHRAVTATRIRNRATTALVLERLKLPVINLDLYAATDGRLWTQDITLERREGSDFAQLGIPTSAPARALQATRITAARTPADTNVLVRAFSSIFG